MGEWLNAQNLKTCKYLRAICYLQSQRTRSINILFSIANDLLKNEIDIAPYEKNSPFPPFSNLAFFISSSKEA